MKKIICLVVCITILVILTSCGSKLPKGEASTIILVSGGSFDDATFEYVNEHTVKIISDGEVYYVPNSYIKLIKVK